MKRRVLVRSFVAAFALTLAACGGSTGEELAGGADVAEAGQRPDVQPVRRGRPSISVKGPDGVEDGPVDSPVRLMVRTHNFVLAPAGRTVDGEGHLHVLIDQPCLPPGIQFAEDVDILDLDDGSSEIDVHLASGRHELCVQVGDGFDVAVAITDTIVVDVAD